MHWARFEKYCPKIENAFGHKHNLTHQMAIADDIDQPKRTAVGQVQLQHKNAVIFLVS
jgi:hypothetical protein